MVMNALTRVAEHPRRAALGQDGAGLADGELLECFINRRDEGAFETLLRRHGPKVLGLCRALLRNEADAEDAFQVTFLVLARTPGSIRKSASLGSWLHGVAYRTALKTQAQFAKRRQREASAAKEEASSVDDLFWGDVQSVLHAELKRLPEKLRSPVVLCHLEGRSRRDVARQLGIPVGILSERLKMARRILAKRLS